MSKSKISTKEKILDKALEMFNERGIEYVGLRELAGILDMRVSNITYYFPTKDDLVYALSLELAKENNQLIANRESISLYEFLQTLHQVFKNHVKFRCLLLSVVHVLSQNKNMASTYKKTQASRFADLRSNMEVMEKSGYLKFEEDADKEFLITSISLVSRFWISEASISFRNWNTDKQVSFYLEMIARHFKPYATAKGLKDINRFTTTLSVV
jgi:AcrR family transcriptional regulator